MLQNTPNHYSYDFKFDIERLPAKQKDKIPSRLAIPGIIFGFLLFAMGLTEIVSYLWGDANADYEFNLPQNMTYTDLQFQRFSFDGIVILMGLVVLAISIASMLRYKQIYFDGTNVKIEHKPLFGNVKKIKEHLYNYLGVLLKVEYYQMGLINRNRYIIELYHKDKNKCVPLYISTSGKDVRKIWEYYSRKLRMPALFISDSGLVSRNHNELNNTLKDMSKKWHLKALYRGSEDTPLSIKCVEKHNKLIIKERRLFFDIYSILAMFGVFIVGALLVYGLKNYDVVCAYLGVWWSALIAGVLAIIIAISLLDIFSKDVLIISGEDIILGHNVPFLHIDAEFMAKDKVAAVDIGHNPITDRYYLSIIAQDKTIIFGKNMPIDDLRWVRGYVIRAIVKK